MNHPNRDEWVPYLFGEAKPAEHERLRLHLRDCAECREEIARWQETLGRLDAWKLPAAAKASPQFEPLLKWALAASVLLALSLGFSAGRLTARPSPEKLRVAVEREVRSQLAAELAKSAVSTGASAKKQQEELLSAWARAAELQRVKDYQAFRSDLDRVEGEHLADFLVLRKDLDTLALNADAGLRSTEQQLVRLVASAPASNLSEPSQNESVQP